MLDNARIHGDWKVKGIVACAIFVLSIPALAYGQDRDRDRVSERDRDRITRLEPGTVIPVRATETIDVERRDNRIYPGIVDQDVRGTNGALAIPRGSPVELIVRVAPDNDLILDIEAVRVNGQRYALRTDPNRIESQRDNSLLGTIVGAINGGQARDRAVRVQRDTVVTFRLDRPIEMGVADRGVDRDGHHYHDYYGDYYRNR
jgi:hypothetical protein